MSLRSRAKWVDQSNGLGYHRRPFKGCLVRKSFPEILASQVGLCCIASSLWPARDAALVSRLRRLGILPEPYATSRDCAAK